MVKTLISVIIPAYNVENYIDRCVRSVLDQTWENIEVLLVDDGSTDSTGKRCDELALKHPNIRVIHQENSGLSVARNVGFENSTGEWVAFLDSDDWIEPEMYETLYRVATENQASISSCLSRDVQDGQPTDFRGDDSVHVLNHRDIVCGLFSGDMMRFEVWNKLWKRELIEDIRFVPGQVAEDVHFDRIAFEKAKRIAHVNTVLHNYLISRPGNTNSSFKVARLCIFDEFKQWKKKLEDDHERELSSVISAVAANFAADIYCNAVRARQPQEICNAVRDAFVYFYAQGRKAKMRAKRRLKLFAFRYFSKAYTRMLCGGLTNA